MTFVKNYTPWNKGKHTNKIPWNKGIHTGLIPWNKDKHWSDDIKQKMRENTSRYWLGKTFTLKHRKNMSLAKKGLPSPLKGRPRPFTSIEHRRNLSIAIKRWHRRKKRYDKIQNSKRN